MYLSLQDFLALCGVEQTTLEAYRNARLFMPHHINEKGEPFYLLFQFYDFSFVHYLRTLGLSLEELAAYMPGRNKEKFKAALEKLQDRPYLGPTTKNRLQKQLAKFAEVADSSRRSGPFIAKRPRQLYLKSELLNPEQPAPGEVSASFLATASNAGLDIYGFSGTISLKKHITGAAPAISYFFTEGDEACLLPGQLEKLAADYLCCYHSGPMDTIGKTQFEMLNYANTHNIALGQTCFTSYILGGMSTERIGEYLLLLEWELA